MTTIKLNLAQRTSSTVYPIAGPDWNTFVRDNSTPANTTTLPLALLDVNEVATGASLTLAEGASRADGLPTDPEYYGWPAEVFRCCLSNADTVVPQTVRVEGLPAGDDFELKVCGWRSGAATRESTFIVPAADPPDTQAQTVGTNPQPLVVFTGTVPANGILDIQWLRSGDVQGYLNGFELTYSAAGPAIAIPDIKGPDGQPIGNVDPVTVAVWDSVAANPDNTVPDALVTDAAIVNSVLNLNHEGTAGENVRVRCRYETGGNIRVFEVVTPLVSE